MPVTSPDNIYLADTATPSNAVNVSAAEATSVQAAFSVRQIKSFKVANLAGLNAITGMSEGDVADRADIDTTYRYTGSGWASTLSGLIPVIPASVSGTGVTLSPDGIVNYSASTAISVNGCFTSRYRNYQIFLDVTGSSSASSINMRMRNAGTDDAGASNYAYQALFGSASAPGASANSAWNTLLATVGSGLTHISDIKVYSPNLAVSTRLSVVSTDLTTSTGGIGNLSEVHLPAIAQDGFTVFPSGGNINGNIRIFGIG